MPKPEIHVLAAAMAAFLALASVGAHGREPSVLAMLYAPADKAATDRMAASTKVAAADIKKKKSKPGKAKLHSGLNGFRTPARRALDRIGDAGYGNPPANGACAAISWSSRTCSQAWASAAASQRPARGAAEDIAANAPDEAQPGLARANRDLPGLVPGRESSYKVSLNLPLGRYENVLLQANVRKNVFNTPSANDSAVRADWLMRF